MQLSDFDYELPPERIAQAPLEPRDGARLLWLHRGAPGGWEDRRFRELPQLLQPGDLLVANDSRVFPARLLGHRAGAPGAVEVLLLEAVEPGVWDALARPGRKLRVGERLVFAPDLEAEIVACGERGVRRLRFHCEGGASGLDALIDRYGHTPLPPYIRRPDQSLDRARYQTIFARLQAHPLGSAAAPTAGLHFTAGVLAELAARDIEFAAVSLHVGLGTFQTVESMAIEAHAMHSERFEVNAGAAAAINRARREGRRIIAVGTTSARVLETVAAVAGASAEPTAPIFEPMAGETRLFLYPGQPFHVIHGMLTNFHAPRTTLLMMIAAFAGMEAVRHAYDHALAHEYRFLSYGDCMLIS